MRILIILVMLIAIGSVKLSAQSGENCKERLPEIINSYQPAIVPVLHPDGNVLYFDRQNHPQNAGKHLDIDEIWYSAKGAGTTWEEPQNAGEPYNSRGSNVMFGFNPAATEALIYSSPEPNNPNAGNYYTVGVNRSKWLEPQKVEIDNYVNLSRNFYGNKSSDGKVMMLALEDSSSHGSMDIYASIFENKRKKFAKPVNLGNIINTKKLESSPFLAYDMRTLYFSSEGHGSKGKLDLYMSRRIGGSYTKWSEPVNLGSPINTDMDENSIYLSALSDTAYIVSYDTVSKRQGIYFVCLPDSLKPLPYIILKGTLKPDDRNIINGKFNLFDEVSGEEIEVEIIDNKYTAALPEKSIYKLDFNLPGYQGLVQGVDLRENSKIAYLELETPLNRKIDIVEKFAVYFDYNSYELSNKAKEKIGAYFENPGMNKYSIIITGHTDIKGSDSYNRKLSLQRAEAVKNFMLTHNFPVSDITTEGKGESEPVSSVDSENRRVEIVLKITNK